MDDIKVKDIKAQDVPIKDQMSVGDKRNCALKIDGLAFEIIAAAHILRRVDLYEIIMAVLGLKKKLKKYHENSEDFMLRIGENTLVGEFVEGNCFIRHIIEKDRIIMI